jgi:DNA-binding NtrC family response regulator
MGVWAFWGEEEDARAGERARWWEARLRGTSAALARTRRQAAGVAPLASALLVTGEPGSGRTHLARALHEQGRTPGAPFLVWAPLEWPANATTPAAGTVCVREVEELTPQQQAWCARLVASPPPVARLVACGRPGVVLRMQRRGFDVGLLRQLQRFELAVPALRERSEDVPALASELLAAAARELGVPERAFAASALAALREHAWFGNVAELKHATERLAASAARGPISRREVAEVLGDLAPSVRAMRSQRCFSEREDLIRALTEAGGNIARAAERLGRSRAAVYRLVEKHGVSLRS